MMIQVTDGSIEKTGRTNLRESIDRIDHGRTANGTSLPKAAVTGKETNLERTKGGNRPEAIVTEKIEMRRVEKVGALGTATRKVETIAENLRNLLEQVTPRPESPKILEVVEGSR